MKIRIALGVLAITIVVLELIWMSEWPQRYAIERGAKEVLGAYVLVSGVDTSPTLIIDQLMVYQDDYSDPFAKFERIEVEYFFFSDDYRRIAQVHIDSLYLYPDASNPDDTNFEFVLDYIAKMGPESDGTWTPTSVVIDSIEVDGAWEQVHGKVGGLRMHIDFLDGGDMNIVLQANNLSGNVEGRIEEIEIGTIPLEQGTWELSAKIRNQRFHGALKHEVAGIHRIEAEALITQDGEHLSVDLRDVVLGVESDVWNPIIGELLDEILIGYTDAKVYIDSMMWNSAINEIPTGDLHGVIHNLELFNEDTVFYKGDFEWGAEVSGGEDSSSEMWARLGDGLELNVNYKTAKVVSMVSAQFASWEKGDIIHTFPNDLTLGLEELPFDQLHGQYELTWNEDTFDMGGFIQSTSKEDIESIKVDIQLAGEIGHVVESVGEITAHVGGGKIHARGMRDENDDYRARVEFEAVPIRPLIFLASGNQLPESVSGILEGSMKVLQPSDSQHVRLLPELEVSKLKIDETLVDTIRIAGVLDIDTEAGKSSISNILVDTVGESLHLGMKEGTLDIESGDLHGKFEYAVDLALAGLEGLYGGVQGHGTLHIEDGQYSLPFDFDSGDAGYEEFALPYGTNLTGGGTIYMDDATGEWRAENILAHAGEGSELLILEGHFTDAGLTAKTRYSSDLKLGIEMGYFKHIDALFEGTADWEIPSEGELKVQWEVAGKISDLVLIDNAGTIAGLAVSLEGSYDEFLQGKGTFELANVTAAGAKVDSMSGPLTIEENTLFIDNASAEIFDGVLTSSVEVGLLENGFPLKYRGKLENIDLARLTEEVKPPKTELTGIANGVITAAYNLDDGIKNFDLDAQSDENFTISRNLVEEMMQMQNVLTGLAEKKAKKAIDKFLGKSDLRPFDTAQMNVYLLDDVIQGATEMRSVKTQYYNGLNMNIKLEIDKSALVASLKLLEESNFGNVSF